MNADGATVNSVVTYEYDPMDRIAKMTRTGDHAKTETYVHDANHNVIEQTIDGTTTTFTYDRNRLVSSNVGGTAFKYNYDAYGRLRSVTSAGTVIESYKYDGFDHVIEHKNRNGSGTYDTTQYIYDPLDRTATKTEKAGTANAKTTDFDYLGLSNEVIFESVAGEIQKYYLYSPWGKRLAQVKKMATGEEVSYYGYNPHGDVEMLYDENGDVRATYGYTAYGKNDEDLFTGVDKPDPNNPDKEPYNVYRYSGKRWDAASDSYDMGFRDYSPGLNRFLTLDMYNGALADMGLTTDPWTNNRYAFTGGNPISNVDWMVTKVQISPLGMNVHMKKILTG